jgi:tetrathionate reductase subunit A
VPDADAREIEIFLKARRHLPAEVFDAARWERIVGPELWPKVVYVLNRGGRFETTKRPTGEMLGNTHPYGKLLNLYQEKTAARSTPAPASHPGYATYVPIATSTATSPTALREGITTSR